MSADKPELELGLLVWINYGAQEGWRPRGFSSPGAVTEFIEAGGTGGFPFVVTKRLRLDASKEYHDA